MVSLRCKMVVKEELKKLGINYLSINLGQVNLVEKLSPVLREKMRVALSHSGLQLMDDKKSVIIEKIKDIIIEMVHYEDELPKVNFSDYLSEKLDYNYTYLANLFSDIEGITIEHFIIIHKIERVKELLHYDELSLTEIAHKLHYSSVGHVSNQFKKMTGMSPSLYKRQRHQLRQTLESLH